MNLTLDNRTNFINTLMTDSGLKRRLSSDQYKQVCRDKDSKRVSKVFSKDRPKPTELNAKALLSKVLTKLIPQSVTNKSQPKDSMKPLRLSMNKKGQRPVPGEKGSQENSTTNKRKLSKLFRKDHMLKTFDPRLNQSMKRQNSWCFSPGHNASTCYR